MKRCSVCKREKPFSEFHKLLDKYQCRCKLCKKNIAAAHAEKLRLIRAEKHKPRFQTIKKEEE